MAFAGAAFLILFEVEVTDKTVDGAMLGTLQRWGVVTPYNAFDDIGEHALIAATIIMVTALILLLPLLSQCFRTIGYYGLPFSIIKRRIKSHRQRQPWFLYTHPRVILVFAVVGLTAAVLIILVTFHAPAVSKVAVLLIMAGAFTATLYGRRYFALSTVQVLKRSGAPPVVFLRSFTDEHNLERSAYWTPFTLSFERLLKRVVSQFGPFVAIGKPGEALPPAGAARTYKSDNPWQVRVLELIRSSKLVLMLAGSTEGLKWELKRIVEEGHHRKLLILMPPVNNAERRMRLRSLAMSLEGTVWFNALSQAVADDVTSVELRNDGTVTLVTAPGYRQDELIFRAALYLGIYGLWKDSIPTAGSRSVV